MRFSPPLLAACFAAGLALTGCSTVKENTGACPVPPPLKTEERPKPPVSEDTQIWQPGHWDWNGSGYTWREGAWIKRAGGGNLWMDGHWERDRVPAPCYWVPAHWVQ
ncbi:MAG: YXWGXW repeat-containing protein [Alphaproteobacteria bacterium]|nr:YXWGXW repeat-containing protein [Rhodospirillales bacterium]MBN9509177.1 YXWGXW repeat-containing protein [Alphaproteobacteria bacterium]OJY63403.1 MAG: hypothetical protein BGP12_10150 [Rhodospirillales bacterium 70-18]